MLIERLEQLMNLGVWPSSSLCYYNCMTRSLDPVVFDFCDCKDAVITCIRFRDVVITRKRVQAPWFILFFWSVIVSVPLIIQVNPIIKRFFLSFRYVGTNGVVGFQYIIDGNCLIMAYIVIVFLLPLSSCHRWRSSSFMSLIFFVLHMLLCYYYGQW